MRKRTWTGTFVLLVASALVGCADDVVGERAHGPGSGQGGGDGADETAARKAYENDLQWLVRTYGDCQKQIAEKGECVIDTGDALKPSSIVVKGGTIEAQNIGEALAAAAERARAFSDAVGEVARNGLCNLLAPFADAQSPYLWLGAQAGYGAGINANFNVDLVYDLRRRQAATFTSMSAQVGTQNGVGASAYMGIAAGACNDSALENTNLVEAWTTPGCSASASVGLPFRFASIEMQATSTANGCMRGGTVGLGVGASPIPLPVNAGVSRQLDGVGGPWNGGTEAMMRVGQGSRSLQCRVRNASGGCADGKAYVQFDSARDLAIHLALLLGDKGAAVAAAVLALDELDRRNISIDNACPNEVAQERARRTPHEAIQWVCNPAALQQTENPCSSTEDGDWCGSEIGYSKGASIVNCRNGRLVGVSECGSECFREYGYAYCR